MTPVLLLVGTGWMYVVLMMSVAEATSPRGTVLGAVFTFMLYGAGPLALVLYLLDTPARRRRRRAREAAHAAASVDPDRGGHAAGDTIAAVREEP